MSKPVKHKGFSLVELAIVLAITGLLLSTMVTGFARYVEQSRVKQVALDLARIEEAIFGYAMSNGYLPCPDITGFPPAGIPPISGNEDRDAPGGDGECTDIAAPPGNEIGYVPAETLGVPGVDPWGMRYFYSVDNRYSDIPAGAADEIQLGDDARLEVFNGTDGDAGVFKIADQIVFVIYSTGPNAAVTVADASDYEEENVNGDEKFASRDYEPPGSPQAFDDIVRWASKQILFAKLVDADQLP